MSGSSCDGVDAAICKFWSNEEKINYELIEKSSFVFPDALKESLIQAAELPHHELKELETRFSKFLAHSINSFVEESKSTNSLDYIASHGHTVIHDPTAGYTVQIGAGSMIAASTGLSTICDFRSLDMAYGGQGAPLAPIADRYLFPGHAFYLNLGGIVNISANINSKIIGFDVAPCNQMLNALSKLKGLEFDRGGELASSGVVNNELLTQLLANEFLISPYPKSLDNSWVTDHYTNPLIDFDGAIKNKLRTTVEFIALAIKNEMLRIANTEKSGLEGQTVFCTGGGAFNNFMMERITFHCNYIGVEVVVPDPDIIEYKEAMLMALMGYLRIEEKPNCIASVTGASKDCSAGVIYYP